MSIDLSAPATSRLDFEVADLALAEAGRHQIRLAENEMPGLMALREEFGPTQPLAGARIAGSLHMTVQTAVLIETLVALGARVRWASCNIFSTQDEAAAAVVVGPTGTTEQPSGVPVFAWKGETLEEYWRCTERIFDWSAEGADGPNLILDDGGDATLLVHKGKEFEAAGAVPQATDADPHEYRVILDLLRASLDRDPQRWTRVAAGLLGVTEETTTGVHRLYELAASGDLLFPAINVNDSVTKSKFDNKYGIRHSLPDGLNRATDVLIGGKVAFVCGYGDVGKGAAEALRGQGARVIVSEVDPDLRTAGRDGRLPGRDARVGSRRRRHRRHRHGQQGRRDRRPPARDSSTSRSSPTSATSTTRSTWPGSRPFPAPRRSRSSRRCTNGACRTDAACSCSARVGCMNLGNATGHPSFVMSASFTNQVLAQLELYTRTSEYPIGVYVLPKALDEKVARLHLTALGVQLTELSGEQAAYIGVPVEGPYKLDHYRY